MVYRDLLAQLKPRAFRLGLVDPQTGRVDEDEITHYMWAALMHFYESYDLDEYTAIDRTLFHTQSGAEAYGLPDHFGRLLTPWDRDYGGITIAASDGTDQHALHYQPPAVFNDTYDPASGARGQPVYFTLTEREMRLSPTPDATVYRVGGTYIQHLTPMLSDAIPMMLHTPILVTTLTLMASDSGRVTPLLLQEAQRAIATLANSQARRRLQFQGRAQNVRRPWQ